MNATVIRRRRAPDAPASVQPEKPATVVEAPRKRGWTNLHGEIVGEMRRLGADPGVVASSSPQVWDTRADWDRVLP